MKENCNEKIYEEVFANLKSNGIEFEKIKDKIVFRIIGENKMQEYVAKGHGKILNKSMEYGMYVIYVAELTNKISLIITDNVLDEIECDIDEIENIAMKNTEKIYPPVLRNLENVIMEALSGNITNSNLLDREMTMLDENEQTQMHVLTNIDGRYGASVIKYQGLMDKVAKLYKGDYYIIPSSIHEVILLSKNKSVTAKELEFILNDVNKGFVKKNEILGNKVLFYSHENRSIIAV